MLNVRELIWQTNEQLANYPIEAVNLAAAVGLSGSEKIDHQGCINRIEDAARKTKLYTLGRLQEFRKAPEVYHHSEAKFRIICMIRFLQQVHKVLYNEAKIPADVPFFTEDCFIHGALMGDGGTCASLPVVYVAVGRRLGYPLKLVSCLRHQFCRWDEPKEKFNIEVNNHSIDTPDDNHFRQGLFHCNPEMERECCYLLSETPKMELAGFLTERAYLLLEREKRYKEAAEGFMWAASLVPQNKQYITHAKMSMETWQKNTEKMTPPNFPMLKVGFPNRGRRFPDTIPLDIEQHFLVLEAKERCLIDPKYNEWYTLFLQSNGQMPWYASGPIDIRIPVDLWRTGL
jgi:hypothetical protein